MQKPVQGSRSGTGVLLLIFLSTTLTLSGCGANKKDQTEKWESQKQKAFQEFRDRHYESAIETYGKALELAKQIDPEGLQVATTLNDMAVVYMTRNSGKNAALLYQEAENIEQTLLNKDPHNADIMRTYVDTMAGLGKIRKNDGDLAAAEDYFSKGVDIGRRANVPTKLRELMYEYKSVLQQEGKTKQATALNDEFMRLAGSEQLPDKESFLKEQATKLLATADEAFRSHNNERADQAYRQAYGLVKQSKDPKFRADAEGKIATYLCTVNNLPAAESALKATMRDYKEAGQREASLIPYLISYVQVENQLGKHESAKKSADLALKLAKQEYAPDSPQVNSALQAVVNAMIGLKQYDEAIPLFEKSYAMTKKNSSYDSPGVILHTCWLANLYWMANQQNSAEKLMNSYTNSLVRYPKSLKLAGKLFNDYAFVIARSGGSKEAMLFANSAMTVLKNAPGASDEMKRTTQIVKALQTPKSS